MQTGSSGTLIYWKSGQTTYVPLWDQMRERGYGLRRDSEVSDSVRSPEPAMPELEISSASEERAKLKEEEFGKKLEREPEPPLQEPNEEERERK
jgi:hypothetical protein